MSIHSIVETISKDNSNTALVFDNETMSYMELNEKSNQLVENQNRLKKLQNILKNFQLVNKKEYLHQYCEVLIENKLNNQEKYFGRTKHMIPVIFKADNCRLGELANIKITSFNQKNLFGIYNTNKMKTA